MDAGRFDTLARSLAAAGTRRRALAVSLSGAVGLLGLARPGDATAAKSGKCKPKCGECEKCKKGDCDRKNGKKRCKQGKCQAKANGLVCSTGTCQGGACAPPSCSDGIRNGTETDIDCGGTCPRCANGKVCVNRNDCASAFCKSGTCQPCTSSPECSTDASGSCFCTGATAEANRCESRRQVASCDACPEGTTSCGVPGGGIALCNRICGT
jgi:hypothetical protein